MGNEGNVQHKADIILGDVEPFADDLGQPPTCEIDHHGEED